MKSPSADFPSRRRRLCYNFYKLIPTAPSQRQQFRPTFMKTRIARHVAIYLSIALAGYGIGACRQNVMLNPSEDDLLVLNGCVVSACNYLAAVETQHTLEKNFWRKFFCPVMPTIQPATPIAFGKRTARSTDTIGTPAASLFRFTPGTQNQLRLFWLRNYRSIFTRTSQ